jgi:4-hydroxy-3-polyprenylbenzoate decarboxylase
MKRKLIVAVGGSSGAIYTKVLFDKLLLIQKQWSHVGVIFSDNAKQNWKLELEEQNHREYPFDYYEKYDFNAPFASGSAKYDCMIVCPCSMGTMARIASGVSTDLITRAADVILKERRKLILVPRDTPFSLIHINNMKTITEAGGIICPAIPSFYSKPTSFEGLAATVVDRALDLAGFAIDTYRWGEQEEK